MAYTEKIIIPGFHLLTEAEITSIATTLGGFEVAGGKMKETGFEHWDSPNLGATNESGFGAVGGGARNFNSGSFIHKNIHGYYWTADEPEGGDGTVAVVIRLGYESAGVTMQNTPLTSLEKGQGLSVVLAMDNPESIPLNHPMTVEDYDGNIYPLVKIGDVIVMAAPLMATHYADGSPVPLITVDQDWIDYATESTGAMCYYDNDPANGFISIPHYIETFHSRSAMILYGSVNGFRWNAIAMITKSAELFELMRLSRVSKSYQYFSVAYAGRIEQSELKNIDFELHVRYGNKLR